MKSTNAAPFPGAAFLCFLIDRLQRLQHIDALASAVDERAQNSGEPRDHDDWDHKGIPTKSGVEHDLIRRHDGKDIVIQKLAKPEPDQDPQRRERERLPAGALAQADIIRKLRRRLSDLIGRLCPVQRLLLLGKGLAGRLQLRLDGVKFFLLGSIVRFPGLQRLTRGRKLLCLMGGNQVRITGRMRICSTVDFPAPSCRESWPARPSQWRNSHPDWLRSHYQHL